MEFTWGFLCHSIFFHHNYLWCCYAFYVYWCLLLARQWTWQKSTSLKILWWNSGLNVMTREKLEYGLNHNGTVLALWNSENCLSCSSHMWDVYRAIYSFMDENEVILAISLDHSFMSLQQQLVPMRRWMRNSKLMRVKAERTIVCFSRVLVCHWSV